MNKTIGTCSLCGGAVQVPHLWGGIQPAVPTCARCGATEKNPHGPVIQMERKPTELNQIMQRLEQNEAEKAE